MTIELDGSDQNYSASYWISSMYPTGVQLLANINLGIYAYDFQMAERVAIQNLDQIATFVHNTENANADIQVTPPTAELKEAHAMYHIGTYAAKGYFDNLTLLERTQMQVSVCQQFKVKNLAKLIAQCEGVNIRTIHERIQRLKTLETPLSL